jgi:hypothetical protein
MTPFPRRAARACPAVLLAILLVSACSFRGSVSAATSSARGFAAASASSGSPSSAGDDTGTTAAGATTSARPGPTTTPPGTSPARTDRCHTSELTGSLGPETAGAGQRYATLVLRNTGSRTCTVHGFGGVGLAGALGALPAKQVRSGGPPTTVRLAPGGTARSALHWGAINGPGDAPTGDCQPAPITLRVIPPDETDPLSVAWTFGPVCEGGTIEQQAYTS